MSLKTITDFDFGTGSTFTQSQRVAIGPNDVSRPERDFILWLLLEQEFFKSKTRKISRTQLDGNQEEDDEDDDGGDDEDDSCRISTSTDLDGEKLRIAKEYAEETLRAAGINLTLEELLERHRHEILLQLCRSSDLVPGESFGSAPEIFRKLRWSKFRSCFNVDKELGKGSFGEVYHITRKDNREAEYALKKIPVSLELECINEDLKMALNESKFLKLLKGHRNIVDLCDYWLEIENSDNDKAKARSNNPYDEDIPTGPLKFYIQLECCGESLQVWKENNYKNNAVIEKSLIFLISHQLFDGLAHIHQNGILHLDINPKNVLWKDSSYRLIKIVDFGLAIKGTVFTVRCGTPPYVAKEERLTSKSDVYSGAVTIVDVAKSVFTSQELTNLLKERDVGVKDSTLDELLFRSIYASPEDRPSADEFKNQIPDPSCN